MKTLLLHKDVFMPPWAQKQVKKIMDRYQYYRLSKHVIDHAIEDGDRSHGYTLPILKSALNNLFRYVPHMVFTEAFEIELALVENATEPHWMITKICTRIPYSNDQDVCLSIRTYQDKITKEFQVNTAFIVTAWLNNKNDSHKTLDMSKYVPNEEAFINEFLCLDD